MSKTEIHVRGWGASTMAGEVRQLGEGVETMQM